MYNVMDVARYMINYSIEIGRPVSNLKLQKLLYFVQVAFIRKYGIPCFAEAITDKELEYFSFRYNMDLRSFVIEPKRYEEAIFEYGHRMLIRSVVEYYKDVLPWDMVELTHQEEPWKRTDRNEVITIDMLRQNYL